MIVLRFRDETVESVNKTLLTFFTEQAAAIDLATSLVVINVLITSVRLSPTLILVANWAFTLEILRTLAQNEFDFAFSTKVTLSVPAF